MSYTTNQALIILVTILALVASTISEATTITQIPTSMVTATIDPSSVTSVSSFVASTSAVPLSARSSIKPRSTTPVATDRGLSNGATAGIVVGVLALAGLSGLTAWLWLRLKSPSSKHTDSDPISSFLELGRNSPTSGTIKGTSPEIAAISPPARAWIPRKPVGASELPGESMTFQGGLHVHTQPGLITRGFEVNRNASTFSPPVQMWRTDRPQWNQQDTRCL